MINNVCQSKLIKNVMNLENTKVPTPYPQTVTPVASARRRSKYMVTITIAEKFIRPIPMPMTIPANIKNSIELALYEMTHLKRCFCYYQFFVEKFYPMDTIKAPIIAVIRNPMQLHIAEASGPVANISPTDQNRAKFTSSIVALNS